MTSSPHAQTENFARTRVLEHSLSSPVGDQYSTCVSAPARPAPSQRIKRSLTRAKSIRDHIVSGASQLFTPDNETASRSKWEDRRRRHCSRRYGGLKPLADESLASTSAIDVVIGQDSVDVLPMAAVTRSTTHPRVSGRTSSEAEEGRVLERSVSVDSRSAVHFLDAAAERRAEKLMRRDSVARMAIDGFTSLMKAGSLQRRPAYGSHVRVTNRQQSRSFAPPSLAGDDSVFESDSLGANQRRYSGAAAAARSKDSLDFSVIASPPPSASYLPVDLDRQLSVSPPMQTIVEDQEQDMADVGQPRQPQTAADFLSPIGAPMSPVADDVFFDFCVSAPQYAMPSVRGGDLSTMHAIPTLPVDAASSAGTSQLFPPMTSTPELAVQPTAMPTSASQQLQSVTEPVPRMMRREHTAEPAFFRAYVPATESVPTKPITRRRYKDAVTEPVWNRVLSRALSVRERRRFGEGIVGKLFNRRLKRKSELSAAVRKQLDNFEDYRPYFTYWITTVQVIVMLVALIMYGLGPIGFTRRKNAAMVPHTSLVMEQVAFFEQENFWIGPRFADLVHMGAKYSPCMRRDAKIFTMIEQARLEEANSACCIRHDRGGCVQTPRESCPAIVATWDKWSGRRPGPGGRTSGTVCGQDPRECLQPASAEPFKWENDIRQWPICTSVNKTTTSSLPHMRCEITGRPCCIGIKGQCHITTREYCDFVGGYFHDEAALCSQVSCLSEICGMLPFITRDAPDQLYRVFVSIFLHAGVIHCLATVVIQIVFMRDLEKFIGFYRLALIYFGSGVGGNLASAIFVPYQAEVGPAGSHFGLLAALFVDAFLSWKIIVRPWRSIAELGLVLVVLFVIGLFPWIDNWAHLFGFLFGLLLSLAVFPYIEFSPHSWWRRIVAVSVSLCLAFGFFAMLVVLFYFVPDLSCDTCTYFNCIEMAPHFCDDKGMELTTQLP